MSQASGPAQTDGRFYFPGMNRDVMRRATRLFADEVIPQLG